MSTDTTPQAPAASGRDLLPDPSLLEHDVDMSYRQNHGFTPFGPKRERARSAAEARGRGELRRRPVPGRAGGTAEKDES